MEDPPAGEQGKTLPSGTELSRLRRAFSVFSTLLHDLKNWERMALEGRGFQHPSSIKCHHTRGEKPP